MAEKNTEHAVRAMFKHVFSGLGLERGDDIFCVNEGGYFLEARSRDYPKRWIIAQRTSNDHHGDTYPFLAVYRNNAEMIAFLQGLRYGKGL